MPYLYLIAEIKLINIAVITGGVLVAILTSWYAFACSPLVLNAYSLHKG